MNKQFNDLYAFVQVARFGSFTQAAKHLGVSPSALSHSMNGLEDRLGVKLLNRTTRSTATTEAGQQLYERIEPMFATIDFEVAELGQFSDTVKGKIRINAPEIAGSFVIYPMLADFARDYPDVTLELHCENRKVDIVAQRFDLGIRHGDDLAQDMVALQIAEPSAMAVVATPDYFAQFGKPKTPQDLTQNFPAISLTVGTAGNAIEWEFLRNKQVTSLSPRSCLLFNSGLLVKQAIKDSLGIGWLPSHYIAEELASGELVEVLKDWKITYPPLFLYYPKNRQKSQALELLIERMKWRKG